MSRPRLFALITLLLLVVLAALRCGPHHAKPDEKPLPPLPVNPFAGLDDPGKDEAQPFTFRKGPAPPPSVSETVKLPFPPPAKPGKVQKPAAPELKVLRKQPHGDNKLVGAVTVTFNQPMVPVASLAHLRTLEAPLKIWPRVQGRYRWLGTSTVTFEPEKRMPYGTRYVVRVPAGTRAQSGKTLDKEVRWEFSTPRPRLVRAMPHRHFNQAKADTALAFLFNQPVAGKHLLERLRLNNLSGLDFDLVPQDGWAKLKYIGETVATWDPDRTVVVQPKKPLPLATAFGARLTAGLRGEGPLVTKNTINHYFSTYGKLRIANIRCNYYRRCDPGAGFVVRFSNPLVTTEPGKYVKVTPAPGDVEVRTSGKYVYINGSFLPRTQYKISVSLGFKDIHDQSLVKGEEKTLTTGDLRPLMSFPAQGYATMELHGDRKVPLQVASVTASRMRLVRVRRDQLLKVIGKANYSYDDNGKRDPLKGIKGIVVKRALRTGVKINGRARLGISTDEGLGRKRPGVLYIELRSNELKRFYKYANPFRGLVVAVTDIGLMARYDHDKIVVMATSLHSGKALAGVKLELRDRNGKAFHTAKTGAGGVAVLPGRRAHSASSPYVLWGQRGRDQTFAVIDGRGVGAGYVSSYQWGGAPSKKRLKMFVFTDRQPYRPGETVHLSGVLRMEDTTPTGGISAAKAKTVTVRIDTPRGQKLLNKDGVKVTGSGAFSLDVPLPQGADLGHYRVYVSCSDGSGYSTFRVEEYRAPEFAVKVEAEDRPHFFGDTLSAKVGADYLFGAPMSGAEVQWTLRRAEASFTPPRNDGFTFGETLPWWFRWRHSHGRRGGRHGGYYHSAGAAGTIIKRGKSVLDKTGRVTVEAKLSPDKEDTRHGPASFTLEAQVYDQNRQRISNRKVLTVHPASLYVGLRPEKSVVKAKEPFKVSAVLAKLDGKRVSGTDLTIRALQLKNKMTPVKQGDGWTYKWETREVQVASCAVKTAADPASCDMTLAKPGAYLVRAETKDARGRLARTTLRVYVHGPGYVPWRLKNQSRVELVPDKASYEPGDTARVLVKSPLAKSVGFLTISRGGMMEHRVLTMNGNAQVVKIPITEQGIPGIHLGVALSRGRVKDKALGKAARDLGRPTLAHGTVKLPISSALKRVTVAVAPKQKAVRPSGTFDLSLETTDSKGKPISGEVAVMVVDEGVLSLMAFKTPDPLAYFWSARAANTGLQDNRNVLLKRETKLKKPKPRVRRRFRSGDDGAMAKRKPRKAMARLAIADASPATTASPSPPPAPPSEASGHGGRNENKAGGQQRIRSRSLFATTAYFNPSVVTNEHGKATLKIKMPDNLTTFRIMAVALDRGRADRFGKGEAQIKVRKPLLLRPSLPRFLSVGDTFEAAVMVHNETDKEASVDVLVRGRNLKLPGKGRKQVTIAAHQATEVRFHMAPVGAGPARVQFAAVMGVETDAVEKQLPVLLPVTTEAFATYGMTDVSVAQSVVPPEDALPGYGGLEISMSSTALNGLEDSVRYLVDYPYECTEQTASRVLPIFALKDILKDFKIAKLASLEAQKALAADGVRKLLRSQRYDGGWGMWAKSRISWPYLTAYAVFALARAKENGHKIPQHRFNRAYWFLKRILDYPRKEFGEAYAYTTQALSVWALSDIKRYERKHMKRLYRLRNKLPLFARAMLMQAIYRAGGLVKGKLTNRPPEVATLLRELNNAAVQTASAAHFAEIKTESLRLLMHSEDRSDAIVLYALLEVDPAHTLIPKVARGLIQARVKGHWSTTQANAYALTALARYYHVVEKVVPDYVARLWLGEEGFLGQATFKGRQMRVVQKNVPLAALQKAGKEDLVLSKDGPGKLYYRIGLRYAPKDMRLGPEEQGFAVTRVYEPVEGKKDTVTRGEDGTWQVKAGATVRVRLTVVVPDQRYFVAVMDPLPAGFEAVNMTFATSAQSRLGNELKRRAYDFFSWYSLLAFDHKEMRDDRVVMFADRLPAGVYEYTYLARATTYGTFVAAPTKAEEMYRPETFGRTGTVMVKVK